MTQNVGVEVVGRQEVEQLGGVGAVRAVVERQRATSPVPCARVTGVVVGLSAPPGRTSGSPAPSPPSGAVIEDVVDEVGVRAVERRRCRCRPAASRGRRRRAPCTCRSRWSRRRRSSWCCRPRCRRASRRSARRREPAVPGGEPRAHGEGVGRAGLEDAGRALDARRSRRRGRRPAAPCRRRVDDRERAGVAAALRPGAGGAVLEVDGADATVGGGRGNGQGEVRIRW